MTGRGSILWLVLLGVIIIAAPAKAEIIFNDGGIHYIDYPINDFVWVQGTQTTVHWLEGASAIGLEVYDYSYITVTGGATDYDLEAYGHGQITMTSGQIGDDLGAYRQSQIDVSGGSINGGLWAGEYGILTIHGTDFAVDGNPVDYGQITTGTIDEFGSLTGTLTGLLQSGDPLNNFFYIEPDAAIFLVPEPSTLLLLCLGAVVLRRKR